MLCPLQVHLPTQHYRWKSSNTTAVSINEKTGLVTASVYWGQADIQVLYISPSLVPQSGNAERQYAWAGVHALAVRSAA